MKRQLGLLVSVVWMLGGGWWPGFSAAVSGAEEGMPPIPELIAEDNKPETIKLSPAEPEKPVPVPQKATLQVIDEDVSEEEAEPLAVKTQEPDAVDSPSGKMQIEASDPVTGKTVNININSNELTYDPQTENYILTGEVYIIIPEKSTEILADKVTFNSKSSDMVAFGNVFIINKNQVIGTERAKFDFQNDVSTYFHPKSVTQNSRIQSETAVRTDEFLVLKNGRIIVEPEALARASERIRRRGLRMGQGAIFNYYTASRGNSLLSGDITSLVLANGDSSYNLDDAAATPETPSPTLGKPISPNDVAAADFSSGESVYRFKVKTINITRPKEGFDEIVLKRATLRYKNFPVMFAPRLDFGYIPEQNFLTYLGPDIGQNVDYGGVFLGPGWDTQIGKGWLRFSPIVTYGGGKRLQAQENEVPESVNTQLGWGVLGHYRSPGHHSDFGYSGTMREPFLIADQVLFGQNQTRLRASLNQYYTNAFFGQERPHYLVDVTDMRAFRPFGDWLLRTFVSAGVAEDEFFPTRQRRFFVEPKSAEPISTFRLQTQAQLRSTQPLLYLGNFGAASLMAQTRLSFYGTGDVYGILQGGPFVNLVTGPMFTQLRYFYSQEVGESPFVFDSYFQGRNNLQTINSLDLGKYLTVGATHSLSLSRDNARDDFVVGQRFFISVGSKNVRFAAAYDPIQKRSFFGLTFNPAGGQMVTDFDTLNRYELGIDPSRVTQPNLMP